MSFTHHDLMHGINFAGQDVAGWLAQEKLDGWRALWTGTDLVTRQGYDYCAPDWFTAGLPSTPMDCELYLGRGCAHQICKMSWNRKSNLWGAARLVVFDAPLASGGIFDRLMSLPDLPDHVQVLGLIPVASDMRDLLADLHAAGGEGFMLRKPSAPYKSGRTDRLLKLKK